MPQETQNLPPRILAERLIGTESLMDLDKAGIGIFSRDGLRARQKLFHAIAAENRALLDIIAGTLESLPFCQRLRLVHRALAIPCVECRYAQENIVRRRLRRRVRAKRFVAHEKGPTIVTVGPDGK
ncbi:MAG: hypothetical protein AB7D37_04655 [Desulfovibrio sp.]